MTTEEVLDAALDLESQEREFLIERLMASLAAERFASQDIEHAWRAEIQRRSAEIDAGTADLVDWADVRSRIAARRARR